jgi:hypothetical protein
LALAFRGELAEFFPLSPAHEHWIAKHAPVNKQRQAKYAQHGPSPKKG